MTTKAKEKTETEELPDVILLKKVFYKRQKSFISALQETLYHISHDKVVREILQNKCTAQFLADRVSEVFNASLNNERNSFTTSLYKKVQLIENFYLSKHIDKLKDIESKLMAATNEQNTDEQHHMKQIVALTEQVKALQDEIATIHSLEVEKVAEIKEKSQQKISILKDPTHIYSNIDLTDMMTKVKLIQAESDAMQRVAHVFFKNTRSLFKYLKNSMLKRIDILEKEKTSLLDQIKLMKNDVEACKQNYEETIIPAIKKDLEIQLNNQVNINKKYNEQINYLQNELLTLNLQFQQVQPETLQLKSQVKALEDKLQLSDKEIANLQTELRREKEYSQKINEDLQMKSSMLDKVQLEKTTAECERMLLQQSNSKYSNQINEKEAQLQKVIDELGVYRRKLPEIDDKRQSLEKDLQNSNNENNLLQERINRLEPELQHAKRQVDTLKEKLIKLKNSHDSTVKENANNADLIIQHENTISNMSDELDRVKNLLAETEKKASDLQSNFKSQSEQLKQSQENAEKFEQEKEKLQKDVTEQQMLISTQKAKLEFLNDSNEKLTQKQAELEKQKEQLEQENRKITTDITQVKSQLREHKEKNDVNSQKVAKLQTEVGKLKDDLQQAKKEAQQAISTAEEAKRKQEDLDAQNAALLEQNTVLQEENEDYKKKIVDGNLLNVQLTESNERNKALSSQCNSLQKQLLDLASISRDTKALVDEVQKHIQFKNASELSNKLNDLQNGFNLSKQILQAVNAENPEACIATVNDMKKSHAALQRIQAAMPSVGINEIVAQIEPQKAEIDRLNAEQKRIFEMLSAEPNVDISKTIQDLLYQQRHVGEQLVSASDFISEVLNIVTGSSSGTSLVFPLRNDERKKLIELVSRIKKRFDDDHQTVDTIVERGRARGYVGNNAIEAAEFGSVMIDDDDKSKKSFNRLKETITKKYEASSRREEELLQENAKLRTIVGSMSNK
ncbi:hypothetical protein TVAG_372920 [Trichomonas vaginalis G3]|uniref:Uncharacterized protein n=1 Tax=Trichomonas vaginalis (strain ATCC PRA-98 / G3) TaxID=412133 RepID=A2DZF5_TRIV3|nr:biological adhesion protein [Trichomonas vaginalis G3]EAY14159.1 hypothetical protein TVAG_372920 [Trichomonas vaginalis G3]KAI5540700.1 biological adhesion protein [Trichomonas vaginalis G3]|eukprot:XP_001326382.1 hypothetical protein [Trichomonas vaginalis G3]